MLLQETLSHSHLSRDNKLNRHILLLNVGFVCYRNINVLNQQFQLLCKIRRKFS